MNNLKNMLSKSSHSADAINSAKSQSDDTFDDLSFDDFFADVMKAANSKASENYVDTNSIHWKTDVNTFRAGASFALQWFSEKIQNS